MSAGAVAHGAAEPCTDQIPDPDPDPVRPTATRPGSGRRGTGGLGRRAQALSDT